MIHSIYNLPCHSAPPHKECREREREREGWQDLGCIPSNLIDIQALLRPPADNFAGCYNYFSNLDFMMMFHCSDKSQAFHLEGRDFKHSSSTPKLIVFILPVVVGLFGFVILQKGRRKKNGWGGAFKS